MWTAGLEVLKAQYGDLIKSTQWSRRRYKFTFIGSATAAPTPTKQKQRYLSPPPQQQQQQQAEYDLYNINCNPLCIVAGDDTHCTAHFEGKRWFISAFNYDFNYIGQTCCKHSHDLHQQPYHPPQHLNIQMAGPKFEALKKLLRSKRYFLLPFTGQRPNPTKYDPEQKVKVRGVSFGLRKSRETKEEREANGVFTKAVQASGNTDHPDLYKALKEALAESLGPSFFGATSKHQYRSLFLSYNALSLDHVDTNNLGDSVVFTMGDYTGGELMVKKKTMTATATMSGSGGSSGGSSKDSAPAPSPAGG
jgi:hypothetical protein